MEKVKLIKVSEEDNEIRLDRWFKRHYPDVPYVIVEKALRKGQIKVDGKKSKSNIRVKTGQEIRVPPMEQRDKTIPKPKKEASERDIRIIQESVIYKDKNLIIINKPAGLSVQGGSGVDVSVDSLLDYLKFENEDRPKLVHRLDKDTSGILCIARSANAAAEFSKLMKDKKIQKTYHAIVTGQLKNDEGQIKMPLAKKGFEDGKQRIATDKNGQQALTYYRVIDFANKEASLVELNPVTGRKHQLRVHMAAIGNPILGDGKYGGKSSFITGAENRLHLHAKKILLPEFFGKKIEVEAKYSKHIKDTIEFFGFFQG